MLAGARVLVTGGAGFLGRHVVSALEARGATAVVVRRADADLRDRSAVDALFARVRPDFVVHAAATGGGIGWMREHPHDALVDNVLMTTNVLAACRAARRVVGVGSACAYAVDAPQPMVESDLFAGEPEPTNGPYGWAKRLMLVHGRALCAQEAADAAFVVPTNLFGPGDDFGPTRSHVVGALVRRFEEARRDGTREVVCWGTGRATRDLLHVRDAAAGVVAALEQGGGPAPVNLGSGVERSIRAIAEAVARAVGFSGTVAWDPTRPDGMPRKVLDVSLAASRWGWAPREDFEAGLREVVEWYRASS